MTTTQLQHTGAASAQAPATTGIDYEAFRADIRRLVDDVIRPNADRNDREGRFPRENLEALARAGYNGVLFPKELDGLGLDRLGHDEVEPGRWYANSGDWVLHRTYITLAPGDPPRVLDWEGR